MESEPSIKNHLPWISAVILFLLLSTVFICFYPILRNGFVWDDEYNLLLNPQYRGLSRSHLIWMFTTFHDGNYHPISWITLGLDYLLWGMNPAGYHLTDLVLHGVNTVMFYWLIIALFTGTAKRPALSDPVACRFGAAVGALFFALHPLRVESVAWISTRGDTVCGVFYFLTLLTYLKMAGADQKRVHNRWLGVSLLFYICSLLSRAWGITLPLILLILDIYPLRRLEVRDLLRRPGKLILQEKIGFALLAGLFGILALLAKSGSMAAVSDHGIFERVLQSLYGIGFYVWKTVVPVDLSPLYVLRDLLAIDAPYGLISIGVLLLTFGLILLARRWPFLLTAWISYIIIASPLLGIVQSGPQAVADRYTYFSCLPFAVLIGAGIRRIIGLSSTVRPVKRIVLPGALLLMAVFGGLGWISYHQTFVWRNNLAFWNRIVELDPKNEIAVNERARLKFEEIGDYTGAEADYSRALEIRPENTDALVSRGLVRIGLKNHSGALQDFLRAVKLDKGKAEIYHGLGLLHFEKGEMAAALTHYNTAITLKHDFADAYNNRGLLQKRLGKTAAAIGDFNAAIRYAPQYPEAYVNRGMIRLERDQFAAAAADLSAALQLLPENSEIRLKLMEIHRRISSGFGD